METQNLFTKAVKRQLKLRLALVGPSGSGKTFTALRMAKGMLEGTDQRTAFVDTENRSASLYADLFDFDVIEPQSFNPKGVAKYIAMAAEAGYGCIVFDSLSHFWNGVDGALEQVDNVAASKTRGNSFAAWKDVAPVLRRMVDALTSAPIHVIVTMRTKTEYVVEENSRGKQVPRKIGLAPEQRAGLEYEFTVVGDMDNSRLTVSKTRCHLLKDRSFVEPGEDVAEILRNWLDDGAEGGSASADLFEELKGKYEAAEDRETFLQVGKAIADSQSLLDDAQVAELRSIGMGMASKFKQAESVSVVDDSGGDSMGAELADTVMNEPEFETASEEGRAS